MTQYLYAIGETVTGADCEGKRFTAKVTELRGPYSVVLDDGRVTPYSLIAGKEEAEPVSAPPPATGQMSMF